MKLQDAIAAFDRDFAVRSFSDAGGGAESPAGMARELRAKLNLTLNGNGGQDDKYPRRQHIPEN
jgi:hypothetical protein